MLTLFDAACFVIFRVLSTSKLDDENRQIVPFPTEKEFEVLKTKSQATRPNNDESEINSWITKWKEIKQLNIPAQQDHFFLERRCLDDFSKELILHAEEEVLIANPFFRHCDLSDTLLETNRKGIRVQIITRPPQDENPEYLEKGKQYHEALKHEGIDLFYDDQMHTKIIIVDREVAIVSSMNFLGNSSAGVSWETGLVTMNPEVVESIVNAFTKALHLSSLYQSKTSELAEERINQQYVIKEKSYTIEKVRQKFLRAYEPWTTGEDNQLKTEYGQGLKIAEIAKIHKRQRGAIRSRLVKLGLSS